MTDGERTLEGQLVALVVNDPDFAELCRIEDHFCPFEAIGMVRQEVRHAHFLAYCLDPERPHGFGSAAFRALLRAAAREGAGVTSGVSALVGPLDIHLMEFREVDVRREWHRIDLLCIARQERLVVAIELKIDAREHGTQLSDYRTTIESEWPKADGWKHLLLLLSKNGDEPSQASGDAWVGLELAPVAAELESLCTKQVGRAEARSLLQSYLSMLRTHHLEDQRLTDLAERLWRKHAEALSFLMEKQPDYGVFGELRRNIQSVLTSVKAGSGLDPRIDKESSNLIFLSITNWYNLPQFRTAVSWTESGSILLVIIEKIRGENGINIRLELGPSKPNVRQTYYNCIVRGLPGIKAKQKISPRYTRILSQSFVPNDKAEDPLGWTLERIRAWSTDKLPAVNLALKSLPPEAHDRIPTP